MALAKIVKIIGFKTTPGVSQTGKTGVRVELYPDIQPRPGQSREEAAKKFALRVHLESALAKDFVAAIQIALADAAAGMPPKSRQ